MIEGRGIPDPWLTRSRSNKFEFPFVQHSHSEKANIKKNIFQYLRGDSYNGNVRDKPCFCCEKKFLFDCPDKAQPAVQNAKDKTNLINCPCLECHGREKATPVVCSQHCNCIPIFQNWVLEHPDSRNCKNREKKRRIPSDLSSTVSSKYNADEESSAESLYPSNYLMNYCSCLKNKRKNIYFDYNNVGMPYRLKSRGPQKGIFTDHTANGQCNRYIKKRNVKSLLCPCLLNFKCKQRESQNKAEEANLRSSKEVQTDGLPLRESKIIQTDKTKIIKCKTDKNEHKCSCDVKWVGSNVIHCDSSNQIFNPQTGQSFAMCFSHPSLVCPYPHTSPFLIHHVDSKKKHKKEKRNCEMDKALQCNLLPANVREEIESPIRTKPKEVLEIKNYFTQPERGFSSSRPIFESFDYSKYLTEKRVKKYLQEKEFLPERKFDFHRKTYGTAINLKKLDDERILEEGKVHDKETEVFKPVLRSKNHTFESLPQEINHESLHKDESHDLKSRIQNSTRKNAPVEDFKQDSPVKIHFQKQLETNESRTYGLVGHCKSSCSQIKKRKKVNRRGRRKPLRVTYSRLKPPPAWRKLSPNLSPTSPNSHDPSNKVGQLNQTNNHRGEVSLKTVSYCAVENNQKALKEETAKKQFLSVKESFPSKKVFHTFTDARARVEQEMINRHFKWNDKICLLETFKKPLKSEPNFSNILQQISSHNSGTTWSSNTLKNIVDELLSERKTLTSPCE